LNISGKQKEGRNYQITFFLDFPSQVKKWYESSSGVSLENEQNTQYDAMQDI